MDEQEGIVFNKGHSGRMFTILHSLENLALLRFYAWAKQGVQHNIVEFFGILTVKI